MPAARVFLVVAVSGLVGCGRIGFDATGATADANLACSTFTPNPAVKLGAAGTGSSISVTATPGGVAVAWTGGGMVQLARVTLGSQTVTTRPVVAGSLAKLALGDSELGVVYRSSSGPRTFARLDLAGQLETSANVFATSDMYPSALAWSGTAWAIAFSDPVAPLLRLGRFDRDGAPLGPSQQVSDFGDCLCVPSLAWNGTRWAVTFANDGLQGGGSGNNIGIALVAPDDTLVGPFAITNVTSGSPAIVPEPDGWSVAYLSSNGVVLHRLDLDGVPQGPPFVVSPMSVIVTSMSLQPLGANRVVTWSWSDNLATMTTVTAALVDPAGAILFGPADLLHEDDRQATSAIVVDNQLVVATISHRDGADAAWLQTWTCR